MNHVQLFYNVKAGDKDLKPDKLAELIQNKGFSCEYTSIKEKGWDDFDEETSLLVVAGGDGSIRTVVKALLQRTLMQRQLPLVIIPWGTANNFSKTLNIPQNVEQSIAAVSSGYSKKIDAGIVEGLEKTDFFIEGMGVGIFPKLMKKMDKAGDPVGETSEEKLLEALKVLEEITHDYEAFSVTIMLDGVKKEGKYLMLEVMNAKSIGPNLVLAENADPTDGEFEVVLIPESHRKQLINHIRSNIRGKADDFSYPQLKAKELVISMPKIDLHVDDKICKFQGGEIRIYIKNGVFEVRLPE